MHKFDVCVVGAGTVGLYLASRLIDAGKRVVVLEAGDEAGDYHDRIVGRIENAGGHTGVTSGWTSGVGGTSQIWGGQLWPWEPWEFTSPQASSDPWLGLGEDIGPRYSRVAEGLGISERHLTISRELRPRNLTAVANPGFREKYSTWLPWRARNFATAPHLAKKLKAAEVITGVRVESIKDDSEGCFVEYSVEATASSSSIRCDEVILAAGTLGNVGLLQHCIFRKPSSDLLGLGFMDHVSTRVAEYRVTNWWKFRRYAAPRYVKGILATLRIIPEADTVRAIGVLPAYGHWEIDNGADGVMSKLRAALRDAQKGKLELARLFWTVAHMGAEAPRIAEAVASGLILRARPILRGCRVYLRLDAQQQSVDENFIAWHKSSGDPALHVQWSVSQSETNSVDALSKPLMEWIARRDIGAEMISATDVHDYTDIFHMMGGTKIGTTEETGVVDRDCRVFGTKHIWVVGPSVFPTGGMANPTFTALALAERLLERII